MLLGVFPRPYVRPSVVSNDRKNSFFEPTKVFLPVIAFRKFQKRNQLFIAQRYVICLAESLLMLQLILAYFSIAFIRNLIDVLYIKI